jgi:hypothetical protein
MHTCAHANNECSNILLKPTRSVRVERAWSNVLGLTCETIFQFVEDHVNVHVRVCWSVHIYMLMRHTNLLQLVEELQDSTTDRGHHVELRVQTSWRRNHCIFALGIIMRTCTV